MKRADLTEKILDIKREKGWTWKHICEADRRHVAGADHRRAARPEEADQAAGREGRRAVRPLEGASRRMLNEVPMRGAGVPMPPTDPLIYRFYELVMVNGPAWKALIEEEFGDGIMSAIDFDLRSSASRTRRATASRSPCPASSCRSSTTAPPATCRRTGTRRSEAASEAAQTPAASGRGSKRKRGWRASR